MTDTLPDGFAGLMALFDPHGVVDPYPRYAWLRAERPVWQPAERVFVLSGHEECAAVLRDPRFGRSEEGRLGVRPARQGAEVTSERPAVRSFLALNPPDHTRLRRLVSRAFTPARVRDLAPRVEALTAELLAAARATDGRFDVITGLAQPLPVAVISELLGLPQAMRPRLVSWSDALARALDPPFLVAEEERERQRGARDDFAAYLRDLVPSRRRSPGGDLISAFIGVHDAGGPLTEDELIGLCMLLLIAGHETTRSLIGAAVLALLRNPAELAVLTADPSLVGQAVEETLRYDPPVQMLSRFALRPTEVSGVTVAGGSFVMMLVGAANRDEALGPDPERFSVRREARRHLAFGHGIHFCLGAPLARLEAGIALRQLLPQLPRLRIAEEPVRRPNIVLRGLEHLWLERR